MAKTQTFKFDALPKNVQELRAITYMSTMNDPYAVAALVAAVLCRYEESRTDTVEMLNALRGSRYMTPYDVQLLRDRLMRKGYIARSYFAGATPGNGYTPDVPYTVTVSDGKLSYLDDGYLNLYITSSGADSPRTVQLRQKGEQWFLWENFLMNDIMPATKFRTFKFDVLPKSVRELRLMTYNTDPYAMAALVPAVLCRYEFNRKDTVIMLNALRGSRLMTPYDVQLLQDRLMDKGYIARSYFAGAEAKNNYTPDIPYTITVSDGKLSYLDDGFIMLYIKSSGDDRPRTVQLRMNGDRWYLWENFLMLDFVPKKKS